MTFTNPAPLWTARDVEKYLGLCNATIKKLTDSGELPAFRVGSRWRYSPAEIEAYLKAARNV